MAARRLYVDNSHDHAFLKGAVLQGLGNPDTNILKRWPKGRSYYDVGYFRSPYTKAYYQSGSLLGLGDVPSTVAHSVDQAAPPEVKRFLLSGEPVPKLSNNFALPLNQVPRIGYGIIAVAAAALSYVSYKRFKKAKTGG
jgi:hypothetical protein